MRAILILVTLACLIMLPFSPAGAAKLGEACDGVASIKCDAGLWCEHPPGQCDGADVSGTCVEEAGPMCMENYVPVCACGNEEFPNDCKRRVAKAQLDHPGECKNKN